MISAPDCRSHRVDCLGSHGMLDNYTFYRSSVKNLPTSHSSRRHSSLATI